MSESRAERIYNLYRNSYISFHEVREFRGSLLIDRLHQSDDPIEDTHMKISSLHAEATHWRDQAKNTEKEGETRRRDILNEFGDYCEISADKMRSEINEPPQNRLTKEMIEQEVENNPETKLERFKRWVEENGVALGGNDNDWNTHYGYYFTRKKWCNSCQR